MKVFLAGDNHHYRRHEEMAPLEPGSPIQKITAGGGGGFLNATHDEDVTTLEEERVGTDEPRRRFALKATYPEVRQSRRLSYANLLFVFKNPHFGIVPALLYLMTVWMVSATIVHPHPTGVFEALAITLQAWNRNPGLTLWAAFVTAIFVVFTDTHSRLYRWLGGLAHAAAHWLGMFARLASSSIFRRRRDRWRGRVDSRLGADGSVSVDLAERLRPTQSAGVQRAAHRGLQAFPPASHRRGWHAHHLPDSDRPRATRLASAGRHVRGVAVPSRPRNTARARADRAADRGPMTAPARVRHNAAEQVLTPRVMTANE
jgi:hypothetical protein